MPITKREPLDPKKAYFVFKYLYPASAQDPLASFVGGFQRAYRDSVSDQVDFVQLIPMLQRLLDLLEQMRIERDVVRAVASGEVEI